MNPARKQSPWLTLFRLPNLPTAIGDALAGAGLVACLVWQGGGTGVAWRAVAAAALAELLLYMAGLVDNDLTGLEEDARQAPTRPLPSGGIGVAQARAARAGCFIGAILAGFAGRVPDAWWLVFAAVTLSILLYNRFKKRFALFGLVSMGLCRGLAVLLGAAALAPADVWTGLWQVWVLALGWTVYITAVTWLAVREHEAKEPLGGERFWAGAVSVAIPAVACIGLRAAVVPLFCLGVAFVRWCISVAPLGRPHSPAIRRKAVGDVIETLLYVQDGFLLLFLSFGVSRHGVLIGIGLLVLLRHWLTGAIHRLFPSVSGS